MTRFVWMIGALGCILLSSAQAEAQPYPARPVTLIVPYAAGGPADSLARLVTDRMSRTLGQQVIVENVTGAGGTIGAARGAASPPDGYTIILASNGTHAAAPALYQNLRYDPIESHEMIGMISKNPIAIVGRKSFPATDLRSMIAHIREQGDKTSNATGGPGSVSHIACLYFKDLAKIQSTEVPYRGTGPAIQDLLADRVDYVCDQVANVMPYVIAGSLKAFAVASETRSRSLPDVPTTQEAGMPDYKVTVWFALMAPKSTPASITARLTTALNTVLDDPIFVSRIEELGGQVPTTPERGPTYLHDFVRKEISLWVPLLKAIHTPPN
jgi:tripartite-type tricarboxylate transporter receptor subunit TctC